MQLTYSSSVGSLRQQLAGLTQGAGQVACLHKHAHRMPPSASAVGIKFYRAANRREGFLPSANLSEQPGALKVVFGAVGLMRQRRIDLVQGFGVAARLPKKPA